MRGKIGAIGLALLLAFGAMGNAQDPQSWGQACVEFQKNSNSKDASERASAAAAIGNASYAKTDKQAVGMLTALLAAELARDKSGNNEDKISGLVLEACEDGLKQIVKRDTKDTVDPLVAMAKNKGASPRLRFVVCRALGNHSSHVKTLVELLDDPEYRVVIGALDGLTTAKDASTIDPLLKLLNNVFDPKQKGSRDFPWETKWSALQALAAIGDKSDKVTDSLIDALGKCTPDEGRIKVEIMRILGDFLGIKDPKSDDPNWWKAAKKDKDAPAKSDSTTIEPTEFFGLKAKSTRIVFVLDRTGSMADPCTFPEKPKDPPKEPKGPATETNGKEKPSPADEAARNRAEDLKKKYDDRKVVSKMDGLKREFINTIYNLDKRVYFTVIWYEGNQQWWKEQLVPATWQNKLDCIQEIDKLNPSGGTNVWGGLEAAFKLMEQPNRPDVVAVDKRGNYATIINGPDTIFLMTDGNHNTGKFVKDPGTPSASPAVDDFIAELKKVNAVRKLVINVVALGDIGKGGDPLTANSLAFLQKIADVGGTTLAHIGKK